eukprot:768590-Hanusia_phi.AAC.17
MLPSCSKIFRLLIWTPGKGWIELATDSHAFCFGLLALSSLGGLLIMYPPHVVLALLAVALQTVPMISDMEHDMFRNITHHERPRRP